VWATLVAMVLIAAVPPLGAADDPRQIVAEAQRRTNSASLQYEGLLQVLDAGGKITDKQWTFQRLGAHGQSKAVLRFTAPREVAGVALLIVNHPDRASDQWMWTPAIERDRRIAFQDRSTRFFGTDFSFEDLEERDVDQYDYSLEGDDTVDNVMAWKIRATPKKSRSSQYTHSIVWVRKDNYGTARIEGYSGAKLVRRMNYTNFQNIQGTWTARQIEVIETVRNSRTRLNLEKVEYNAPLRAEDFTLPALRRQ
jgi:outer membrane lipoprotein-sorting protein